MVWFAGACGRALPAVYRFVCDMRESLTTRIISGLATGGSYFSRQPLTREEKVLAAALKVHRAVRNNISVLGLDDQLERLCAAEAEAGDFDMPMFLTLYAYSRNLLDHVNLWGTAGPPPTAGSFRVLQQADLEHLLEQAFANAQRAAREKERKEREKERRERETQSRAALRELAAQREAARVEKAARDAAVPRSAVQVSEDALRAVQERAAALELAEAEAVAKRGGHSSLRPATPPPQRSRQEEQEELHQQWKEYQAEQAQAREERALAAQQRQEEWVAKSRENRQNKAKKGKEKAPNNAPRQQPDPPHVDRERAAREALEDRPRRGGRRG